MAIAELEPPFDRVSRRAVADRRASVLPGADRRLRTLEPLVVDDGCDVRLRGGRHTDVVRVALLEWLPLTRGDLLVIERGHLIPAPSALAALVRPPTIWTAGDALLAAALVGGEREPARKRQDELVEYAFTRLGDDHLKRLRCAAERFACQLPLDGLPQASAMVATGCAEVARDDEACAAVAAIQLARYAGSAFVARRRMEAAPTMS